MGSGHEAVSKPREFCTDDVGNVFHTYSNGRFGALSLAAQKSFSEYSTRRLPGSTTVLIYCYFDTWIVVNPSSLPSPLRACLEVRVRLLHFSAH